MKKIFLHIGFFKTGTTALQSFCHSHRSTLAEEYGVFYPSFEGVPDHHVLTLSLMRHYGCFDHPAWPKTPRSYRDYWNDLISQIEGTECERIVISSEYFADFFQASCDHLSEEMLKYVYRHLKPYPVNIICYLRRIDRYLLSMYSEVVKNSSTRLNYSDFVSDQIALGNFHVFHSKVLTSFSNIFGKENIIVRLYDRNVLKGQDIIQDFFDILGLDLNENLFGNIYSGLNPSISRKYLPLKLAANINLPPDFPHRVLAEKLLAVEKINLDQVLSKVQQEKLKEIISLEIEKLSDFNHKYPELYAESEWSETSYSSLSDHESDAEFNARANLFIISLLLEIIQQNDRLNRRLDDLAHQFDTYFNINGEYCKKMSRMASFGRLMWNKFKSFRCILKRSR